MLIALHSFARLPVMSIRSVSALCCFIILIAGTSCGDSTTDAKTSDTNNADSVSVYGGARKVQTDSGILIITRRSGEEIEDAVLQDANGKILSRGHLLNNQPTGAWLKYDESGNVIQAVHYTGTSTLQLDAEDFITERVVMSEMGITFVKPLNWDTVSPYNPKTFVSYEKNISAEGLLMKPNINISKGNLEPGQTLESLAAEMLNMLHNAVGRVELVDEAYVTIDSCRSFRRYGMYYTDDNKIGFMDAIIVHGSTIYVVSCAAQNKEQGEFLQYQSVFESLLLSIQVD